MTDIDKLKELKKIRPEGGRKWSYWWNLLTTGYTHYSDYKNFEARVKHERKIIDLEIKIYGYSQIDKDI